MPLSAELRVSSLSRSLRFYTDILGFATHHLDAQQRRADLERAGSAITLSEHEGSPAGLDYPYGRGMTLLIWVGDVEAVLATAEAYGARIITPPEIREHNLLGERRSHVALELADPDGYALRFCQSLEDGEG